MLQQLRVWKNKFALGSVKFHHSVPTSCKKRRSRDHYDAVWSKQRWVQRNASEESLDKFVTALLSLDTSVTVLLLPAWSSLCLFFCTISQIPNLRDKVITQKWGALTHISKFDFNWTVSVLIVDSLPLCSCDLPSKKRKKGRMRFRFFYECENTLLKLLDRGESTP